MPKIEIKTDGVIGTITHDGVQLKGVVGYSVKHGAGKLPVVTVEFLPTELSIEASEVEMSTISDESRRFATTVAALPRSGDGL